MGTAIVGCGDLICLDIDKAGLGCCGTAVHTQYVLSAGNCLAMLCREVGHFIKLGLEALQVCKAYLVLCDELVSFRHGASILLGQICSSQCLEIGGFFRNNELDIRSLLLDEPDNMAVSGDSAHQYDLALADSCLF